MSYAVTFFRSNFDSFTDSNCHINFDADWVPFKLPESVGLTQSSYVDINIANCYSYSIFYFK